MAGNTIGERVTYSVGSKQVLLAQGPGFELKIEDAIQAANEELQEKFPEFYLSMLEKMGKKDEYFINHMIYATKANNAKEKLQKQFPPIVENMSSGDKPLTGHMTYIIQINSGKVEGKKIGNLVSLLESLRNKCFRNPNYYTWLPSVDNDGNVSGHTGGRTAFCLSGKANGKKLEAAVQKANEILKSKFPGFYFFVFSIDYSGKGNHPEFAVQLRDCEIDATRRKEFVELLERLEAEFFPSNLWCPVIEKGAKSRTLSVSSAFMGGAF